MFVVSETSGEGTGQSREEEREEDDRVEKLFIKGRVELLFLLFISDSCSDFLHHL